jgi:hypothetical protein
MAAVDKGSLEVDVVDGWDSIIGATSVVTAAVAIFRDWKYEIRTDSFPASS